MQNYTHVRILRLAFAWLGRWILILSSFCLVPSLSYSQDVLWGLTSNFGPEGAGTAFSLETNGANFQIHKAFENSSGTPYGSLVQGSDGAFYGITRDGGTSDLGTIFSYDTDGTFTKLKDFKGLDGAHPQSSLVQGTDGFFYGLTSNGGSNNAGTIFKISPDGSTFTKFKDFDSQNGGFPGGSLVQGMDGAFYGLTVKTVFKVEADGTFTTVKRFENSAHNNLPVGSLVQGTDGFFYGMTIGGGSLGFGTVFKMDVDGTFTTLINFDRTDGGFPYGSLVQGKDGAFYGMSAFGGAFGYGSGNIGYGTIFKLTTDGTFTKLKDFDYPDGIFPQGSLVQGSDGAFYGMTSNGGLNRTGTIFKLAADGTFTKLKDFGISDGASPRGSLVQGTDGFFYGMTIGGSYKNGTIFKLAADGAFTKLKDLGIPDSRNPSGSLVLGRDGAFYGMSTGGGSNLFGTIFKLAADGTYSKLKDFDYLDGAHPEGSLVQGTDGFFYGMTQEGGSYENGTIFKLAPDGTFTKLKDFEYPDGIDPKGSLVQGTDGFFYGMTADGGSNGYGTIFKLATDGTFTKLKDFDYSERGSFHGSLVQGTDGAFYGMTVSTVFKMEADGTFTTLKSFDYFTDGAYLQGSLVQGRDGAFYGMTADGGSYENGTIFKLAADGTFTKLKDIKDSDGVSPYGSLVQGTDGFFYGMTLFGGSYGSGTIFKIDSDGNFNTLRHLSKSDGAYPRGSLIIQKNPLVGCNANGMITREQYTADLAGKPVVSTLTSLEATNQGDFFVARILGYICPPQTGNYTFWIAGDAATRLTLSPNDDSAKAQLLAYSFSPTDIREYSKYPSQKSAPVYLEAGKKYYIEAQHAAWWGSDHVSVAWQLPDGTMEGPIPGSRLSPYVNDAVAGSSSSLRVQLQDLNQAVGTRPVKGLAVAPNPFTTSTTINYVATEAGVVQLELFTTTGKLLQTLYQGQVKAGSAQQYVLEGSRLAAGVYVCRLTINNKSEHKRILLIK